MRVPTLDVSYVELNCVVSKSTSAEEVNSLMKKYADGALKGVLGYNDEKLVSSDFIGNPNSSIFNSGFTVVGGSDNNFVTVASWYDNENGLFSPHGWIQLLKCMSWDMKTN